MELVLGVSMTATTIRLALVEGEKADGVIVDHDVFDITAVDGSATPRASDEVIATILGTQESAIDAGHHLVSIGVTWMDRAEAAALREGLVARGLEDVLLVSELHAAAALAQAVGRAVGYDKTGLMFVERETATLAVVETADGSVVKVLSESLHGGDAIAAVADMVSGSNIEESQAQGLLVVGSGIDVAAVRAHVTDLVAVPVIAPEEPHLALARGAALASASAPRYDPSTIGLAYSQDSDGTTAHQIFMADLLHRDNAFRESRRYRFHRRRAGTQQAVPLGRQLADRRLRRRDVGTDHRGGRQYPADCGSRLGGHFGRHCSDTPRRAQSATHRCEADARTGGRPRTGSATNCAARHCTAERFACPGATAGGGAQCRARPSGATPRAATARCGSAGDPAADHPVPGTVDSADSAATPTGAKPAVVPRSELAAWSRRLWPRPRWRPRRLAPQCRHASNSLRRRCEGGIVQTCDQRRLSRRSGRTSGTRMNPMPSTGSSPTTSSSRQAARRSRAKTTSRTG